MSSMKQARQAVQWKDLQALAWWQVIFNVLLPYPFLLVAWWSAWHGFLLLALGAWFLFFASSFRQAHDGFHCSLGLGKKATDFLLCLSSGLIISSNHAIRQTHLLHHYKTLDKVDIEAKFYNQAWWQAVIGGISFKIALHKEGYKLANPYERIYILVDFSLIIIMLALAIYGAIIGYNLLLLHVFIMFLLNTFVGLMAGWCVHHGCGNADNELIARTERNKLINAITFNQLFHMEHHLFPSVPSNHLPQLAKRLDKVAPEMTQLRVVPKLQLSLNKPSNQILINK